MAKKTILAISLIILGVIVGMFVIYTYTLSGGSTIISLAFLMAATACIIAGSILIFSRLLDRLVAPILDEIHKDIDDDVEDLKKSRMTNTLWMVILLAIAVPAFSYFVFRFHKLEAMWGPIPVVIPTLIGMGVLAWYIPRSRWFLHYRDYTPMWIFIIPLAGLILSVGLGLGQTENLEVITLSPQASVGYSYNQYSGVVMQGVDIMGDWGFVSDLPDCDNDVCGVIFLVVALIALTFILVAGSATIPHFWLLSGSLLLGIMSLIALHDLRIRKEARADEP